MQNMKFIWGVKSWDDLSSAKSANLYTMNDIDLIYLKDENKYILGIETMFMFKEEKHKLNYLTGCLKAFTEFMKDNGYKGKMTVLNMHMKSIKNEVKNNTTYLKRSKIKKLLFCNL